MPFPRRGRRRPFINSRWQVRRLECLCLFLSANVRAMLTAWMKIYGETNDVPGLVSGPIEVRFRRLREHTGADIFLLWTTPEHWAGGEALSLWIPAIGLALECRVEEGRLVVDKARPTTEEERDPRRQRTAIGMELRPDRIELPTGEYEGENPSSALISTFERLLDRRWTSFVDPLREALEAEARDDATRAERLATPYAAATPRIGSQSESDPYRLSGVEASAVAAFDEGEWLDLVDTRGRVISSARLVRIDPAEGTMDIDVRGADPPSEGTVRPRPQTQILAQKRAILDELDNPTGGLANAVRLVASPASLPPPARKRPAAFVNRLVAQNRSQVRAVSLALGLEEGQALMVQGPPGTGKSTTLAEILGQLVTRDQNVTVLVCSHSNHGVDNLLLKTLPYLEQVPGLAIARVGLFDRVHPLARPHFLPPGEDLGAFNVVFTTVDALALQVEAGGRTYDYAVLDEANRASILDSLIPLVRGRRFILVGDHLQLQPVLSEAEEQLRLEPAVGNTSAIGKSLFAWLRERRFPEAATVFLEEQNRMHPVIAGLISEVFYEGKLRSGRRAPRRVADVPLFPAPVTWVDTRGLHGLREARGRGASLVNVPEARLVATIARHILSTSQKEIEIGVISAYAEQTALLRRLLLNRNNPRQNGPAANGKAGGLDRAALKLLEIDTVDAFEGREKDIIIVSLVRSNRRRDIGFLRLMQRINVALSRAKTMLIVVGDTQTLRGSYFDRIVRYIRVNGMLVPGPRLIGRLLNARNAERPGAERTAERPVGPSRRRRPLPSPRTAFPVQDPAAAAAGPGAAAGAGAAGSEEEGQRGRRRRRRVRGRPGQEQRPLQPTTTMEMSPVAEPVEPGNDEPATQYEIDRFAALVEQLLGDTSGDEGSAGGSDAASAPEVDRAHAEEVLADALRAVGEQSERTGQSRSRRNNNRRRSRRGQPRPLPGDAAVADAARRMAREELLAAGGADTLPMVMPGDSIGEPPALPPTQTPGQSPDERSDRPAAQATPADVAPREAPAAPFGPSFGQPGRQPERQPAEPPMRPASPFRAFRPFDAPAPPAAPSETGGSSPVPHPFGAPGLGGTGERGASPTPEREVAPPPAAPARRTRRRLPAADTQAPAAAGPEAPAAATTPAATSTSSAPAPEPQVAAPVPVMPAAEPTPAPAPARRRRTAAARMAADEPATASVSPSTPEAAPAPSPAPEPAPEPAPAAPTPARRTRRVAAAAASPVAPPSEAPSPVSAPLAVTPAVTLQSNQAPAAAEPASEPAAESAPVRRTRRRVTAAEPAPTAESTPVAAAQPAPAAPTASPAAPLTEAAVPAPVPAAPRRTRRVAPAASVETATPAAPVEAAAPPPVAPAEAPASSEAAPKPARRARVTRPAAEAAPLAPTSEPAPVRRARTPKPATAAVPTPDPTPEVTTTAAPTPAPARARRRTLPAEAVPVPTPAQTSAPEPGPARRTRAPKAAAETAVTPPPLPLSAPERGAGGEVSPVTNGAAAAADDAAPKPVRRTRRKGTDDAVPEVVAETPPPARPRRTTRRTAPTAANE